MNSIHSPWRLTLAETIFIPPGKIGQGVHPLKKKRSSNKEFTPIGNILEKLLNEQRSNSSGGLFHLIQVWKNVFGPPISDNAKPFAVKGRLLLVHVSSSVWMHQLHFLKADLLDKLNSALQKNQRIEDIKFKIGQL